MDDSDSSENKPLPVRKPSVFMHSLVGYLESIQQVTPLFSWDSVHR